MDLKNLINQFLNLFSTQNINNQNNLEKNLPLKGANICSYPDDFNNAENNSSNSNEVINSENNNNIQQNNLLTSLTNILPLLSLFSGGKLNLNQIFSKTLSNSPQYANLEPLIKLISKSDEKKDEQEISIDSYKKIEE